MSVNYRSADGIAHIQIDDGKANAISSAVIVQLNEALEQAEAERAITIITGREGIFSAGFDLKEARADRETSRKLVRAGAELALRLLQFPAPLVGACNGHAFPMGAFMLMSSDYRIGVEGPYSLGMNEVRIDMTVPVFAVELARGRLQPSYLNRTIVTGEVFSPNDAVTAGILDELVAPTALAARALEKAEEFKLIDIGHYQASKQRLRGNWIEAVRKGIECEL